MIRQNKLYGLIYAYIVYLNDFQRIRPNSKEFVRIHLTFSLVEGVWYTGAGKFNEFFSFSFGKANGLAVRWDKSPGGSGCLSQTAVRTWSGRENRFNSVHKGVNAMETTQTVPESNLTPAGPETEPAPSPHPCGRVPRNGANGSSASL